MSQEQLQAFLHDVKSNASLQEKLKLSKSIEELLVIALLHGYKLRAGKINVNKLREEELESVVGGATAYTCPHSYSCDPKTCDETP